MQMAEGKYTYATAQPTRSQDLFVATMLHKAITLLSVFLNRHLMLVCLLVLLFELMTIQPGVTSIPV